MPRHMLHHHKSNILGSRLIKLGCYQFFSTKWVRVGLLQAEAFGKLVESITTVVGLGA